MTSATLEKPLTRESLVDPDEHLSTPEGSGLFAARTPRLPRIHANRVNAAENATSIQLQDNAHPLVVSTKDRNENNERFLTRKSPESSDSRTRHLCLTPLSLPMYP